MSSDHLSGFLRWLQTTLATESLAAVADHKLLERFLASRDELAIRVIISRHGPMVYRVCRRMLPDEQDTEDAFQAVFLILIRKAGTIRKQMSLASWLHGVAYQVALRARISSQRRRARESRAEARADAVAADDRSWKEVRTIVDEELAGLPEKLRAPLVLCYLEGLTQDEAAEQLGQSKRTLRRYLERGRHWLGARLTRRGLTLSIAMITTLISDSVDAIPPQMAASKEAMGEIVRQGIGAAHSQKVNQLTEEVLKAMSAYHPKLKAITVAILGLGLVSAVLGTLLADATPRDLSVTHISVANTHVTRGKAVPAGNLPQTVLSVKQNQFEKEVTAARKKAIEFLKSKQSLEGSWEGVLLKVVADMEGGQTAMATLALLEAGVPADDKAISRAVEYLLQLPPKKTYVVGLQTQVLARVDAKKYKEQIQKNVDWLLKEAMIKDDKLEGWSYPGNMIGDGSNTHFAVMALYVAKEAGAAVEEKISSQIGEYYLRNQKAGGWPYYTVATTPESPSNSMTACALVGLAIAAKNMKDSKNVDEAAEKGLELLADWDLTSAKSSGYSLMVVAELGRLHEKKEFKIGSKTWKWYQIGAEKVIKSQKEDGSITFAENSIDSNAVLTTSFGLYFLGPPAKIRGKP